MAESPIGTEKKRSFETYEVTVEVADLVTPRNKHLRFRFPADREIHFKAGQFIQLFIPIQGEEKPRRTSYSIASAPEHTHFFDLCVTHVEGGKSSTYLHNLKVGDKVTVLGPLGKFTLPEPVDRDVVFIATGSGIAPFRAMIQHLNFQNFAKDMYLIYGNRFDGDIIYQKDWEQLAAEKKNFKLCLTLSRPEKWAGAKGYVQDQIESFVPDVKNKHFFICGLSPMINAVNQKLLSLGVPATQIHFEKFD